MRSWLFVERPCQGTDIKRLDKSISIQNYQVRSYPRKVQCCRKKRYSTLWALIVSTRSSKPRKPDKRMSLCDSCVWQAQRTARQNAPLKLCHNYDELVSPKVEAAKRAGKLYSATVVILSNALLLAVGGLAVAHIVNAYRGRFWWLCNWGAKRLSYLYRNLELESMKLSCCGWERLLGVQERGSTIVEMRDTTLRGEHEPIGFAVFDD